MNIHHTGYPENWIYWLFAELIYNGVLVAEDCYYVYDINTGKRIHLGHTTRNSRHWDIRPWKTIDFMCFNPLDKNAPESGVYYYFSNEVVCVVYRLNSMASRMWTCQKLDYFAMLKTHNQNCYFARSHPLHSSANVDEVHIIKK